MVVDRDAVGIVDGLEVDSGEVDHAVAKIERTECDVEDYHQDVSQGLVPLLLVLARVGRQLPHDLQQLLLNPVWVVFPLIAFHRIIPVLPNE